MELILRRNQETRKVAFTGIRLLIIHPQDCHDARSLVQCYPSEFLGWCRETLGIVKIKGQGQKICFCGGLNRNDPCSLICLNALSTVGGTVWEELGSVNTHSHSKRCVLPPPPRARTRFQVPLIPQCALCLLLGFQSVTSQLQLQVSAICFLYASIRDSNPLRL